jgi:hypothetical protein
MRGTAARGAVKHFSNGVYSISLLPARFYGAASVTRGGAARMDIETFFAGQTGPKTRRTFRPGYSGNFILSSASGPAPASAAPETDSSWSPCGQDVNLRINSNILAQAESAGAHSFVRVDLASLYQVQLRRCR